MPELTGSPGELSTWRGDFGEAWVETIATAAMVEAAVSRGDKKKTDLRVEGNDGEIVRIQVKTTESPTTNAEGYTFQLDIGTYDRLRQGASRGFVALVVVHQPQPGWTAHTAEGSQVRATAYLRELTDAEAKPGQASVSLSFPPVTMLTQERFVEIFAQEGGHDANA